jgi:hypothetical protein
MNSLHSIVSKCCKKLNASSINGKIYNFLGKQLMQSSVCGTEGNVLKLIVDYFKMTKITEKQILKLCSSK